jgi:hypothetical protein
VAVNPLKSMGVWRGIELAFEGALPYALAGVAFWQLRKLMISPAVGKPLTSLELTIMLGGLGVLVSWAFARQLWHLGRRDPVTIAIVGTSLGLAAIYGMALTIGGGFKSSCEALNGSIIEWVSFIEVEGPAQLCKIGGIPGNAYAPGTLIRPMWDGHMSLGMWSFLGFVCMCTAVGIRDQRMRRSRMVLKLYELLHLAPASGVGGAIGPKPGDGRVQACKNATFWGEICGQLYSADREFLPGEWCGRCNQTYQRAERELTFRVVTLFTDNIDVLNGLERTDTVSWDYGNPMDADARVSGVERWVLLGSVTVPDVISVSQLLSIIHSQLASWKGKEERTQIAVKIAQERASLLFGWIWFGNQTRRLTYARPTSKCIMALSTTRLRDIITDSGEELYFQLDVGLLPLEMRVAFRKSFVRRNEEEEARRPVVQNSKFDLWVPVAPKLPTGKSGLWVPRVEGSALLSWLSTDRLRDKSKMEGVAIPLPYRPYERRNVEVADTVVIAEAEDAIIDEVEAAEPVSPFELPEPGIVRAEVEEEEEVEATASLPEPAQANDPPPPPKEGTLDFIRLPLNEDATDPVTDPRNIAGLFISEWDWLEPEQVQLLRREALVLRERERR